ncbi:VOC family protein [Yinghuangia soli]|uniref:VOC family protein n=1 Tax=Yinghuangia soli TaxID=2908204 RepID=A0AA41Q1W7_9ACTN|nr:VOC family protein [Yinghuangia soli]MCF2529672.1 VOC family protein [Yinghuangia soli]
MTNTEFELGGLCHLALVCQDMQRTVEFYTEVLGMRLAKTVEIPDGGQHFFFDMGGGQFLAFFWFRDAPERAPGVASASALPGVGDIRTAHASMNHVAFKIPADRFEEYKAKLEAKGVVTGPVLNHDDSERGVSMEMNEGTYVRSMYFFDPDGILLEFAAWTRELNEDDVRHPAVDRFGVVPAARPR